MNDKQEGIVNLLKNRSLRDIISVLNTFSCGQEGQRFSIKKDLLQLNTDKFINPEKRNSLLVEFASDLSDEEIERINSSLKKPSGEVGIDMNKDVFIVHGHDKAARNEVKIFLMEQEIKVRILEDEPDSGLTIIENIRCFSGNGMLVTIHHW